MPVKRVASLLLTWWQLLENWVTLSLMGNKELAFLPAKISFSLFTLDYFWWEFR